MVELSDAKAHHHAPRPEPPQQAANGQPARRRYKDGRATLGRSPPGERGLAKTLQVVRVDFDGADVRVERV
jgi:hypothetical protein